MSNTITAQQIVDRIKNQLGTNLKDSSVDGCQRPPAKPEA